MAPWLQILLTAALSSGGTLLLAYLLFRWFWLPRLEAEIDAQVEQRLQGALAEAEGRLERLANRFRVELGETVHNSVRSGVIAGVRDLPSSTLVKDTTRTVARTGAELLGEGLAALLGGRERRRGDSDDEA